jgi:hypothetical protein
MPSKSSRRLPVSFVHLSCAVQFGVDSDLAWASLLDVAPPEQGAEPVWQIMELKSEGRDDFKSRQALAQRLLSAPGGQEPQRRAEIACLVQERLPHLLRDGEMQPDDSDEPLRLYCTKCCVWISVPSRRLRDSAKLHPGHESDAGPLVAYVADRGEVVYRRDAYAEELVRRDRRAKGRQPPSAPIGSLRRSGTWTPVRTAPKGR